MSVPEVARGLKVGQSLFFTLNRLLAFKGQVM